MPLARIVSMRWSTAVLTLVAALSLACHAHAAVTLGFLETWPGTSLEGWTSQALNTNPGTGGTGGNGDGFLRVETNSGTIQNCGSFSPDAAYVGNWTAAGITQIRLWLNDVDADDPLELHFAIGSATNFWHYDVGFAPPLHQWAEFIVDLSAVGQWHQIIGAGTFAQALAGVTRVHIRHDLPPFVQQPDQIEATFGLDHLLLTNGIVGVLPEGPRVAQPVQLAAPVPNPSHGPVALALQVFDGGAVRLEVVDATGRRVRSAELAAGGSVQRVWTWDGLDDHGRAVPAGVYRVRATSPSGGTTRGLVRVN
ncbi:MAG TPA: FlgD immunoglobulin-like domain containing protein [Candidatus Eisenbacteria bacterium]|nr:FlgD immunoglobulin-like domain containing protein [Candidatus Eisenbacteria bacterium]